MLFRRNIFPSRSWLEWGDLTFPHWAIGWLKNEGNDGLLAVEVAMTKHIYTRTTKPEASLLPVYRLLGTTKKGFFSEPSSANLASFVECLAHRNLVLLTHRIMC